MISFYLICFILKPKSKSKFEKTILEFKIYFAKITNNNDIKEMKELMKTILREQDERTFYGRDKETVIET